MKLLILWAGIAAFVLIGLFPPMETGLRRVENPWHIDTARLLCDWAIVVVLTGGLLWSEAQVGPRLYPWLRAKVRRRIAFGMVTVGVLALTAVGLMERCGLADILRGLLGIV